jgi:alpha-galactosidase
MMAGAGAVRVRLLDLAAAAGHPPPQAPGYDALVGAGWTLDGDWLAQAGLPLPAMPAESVALFEVETL